MDLEEKFKKSLGKVTRKFVNRTLTDRTKAEMDEATYNFEQYLLVLWEIARRLEGEELDHPTDSDIESSSLR